MVRLGVIPSDTINDYELKGISNKLKEYYNPLSFFEEVFLLSPKEKIIQYKYGMKIIPTSPSQLKERIRDLNIDLVRAYGGYWACSMACENKVKNVPVIVSVHDTNPYILFDSIKYADFIFYTSMAVKRLILQQYSLIKRLWWLPNKVDFNIMHPRSKEETEFLHIQYPFKYKILHIGRKAKGKNLDTLIKAIRILGNDYCLITIGRGKIKEYKKIAEDEKVIERCFFIKTVKNEELSYYYSGTDCMCTPSRWEGFGIVFIEALACNAVVITSDISPMNDLIIDKFNGLLVKDYENPLALAKTIKNACINHNLRKEILRNAVNSVKRFDKDKLERLEIAFYKKILLLKKNEELTQKFFPYYKRFFKTIFRKFLRSCCFILFKLANFLLFRNKYLNVFITSLKKFEFYPPNLKTVIILILKKDFQYYV